MKITKEIEEFINLTITEHMGKEYADWKLSQPSVTEPDEVEEEYKKVIATLPQEQEEAIAEDSKRWIQSPERKASRKEKEYAINRLDGLIKKIEYAMEKAVVRVVRQLKQPEKKKAVVEEIKKEVKPSIREKLALNVAKIQREEEERKQLNKGRSHSSDLEL